MALVDSYLRNIQNGETDDSNSRAGVNEVLEDRRNDGFTHVHGWNFGLWGRSDIRLNHHLTK